MTRLIKRLLIANRGEIARRIARTCRAEGIETIAIYSEADREMPHVREADRAICIGPPAPASSYLKIESIVDAARRHGADAVHPGYGFLAENDAFAAAVAEAGLIWIGPPPRAIRAMADKSEARKLAREHDVPVVPGFDEEGATDEQLAAEAERIGFPVLVKAAAGGGGRGMRRVERIDQLSEALASARREASGAFGSDKLLLERYVASPRHVEVQVLADRHGSVVHLFERECSIQRRHQKIIEEAPSPAVDEELRDQLGRAAVRMAELVGYEGAATVEFLLDEQRRFYFLEMNTRLQVEHPVTEMITGLDLVALQITVAEGEPLPWSQEQLRIDGHAIEARVYAEDPVRDYMPSSGELLRFEIPAGEGVRVDAGYDSGDHVGVHYDSMLAKVIAHGPDRARATRRLSRALESAWVPGLATNLPQLRAIFAHQAWADAALDTHFLERVSLPPPPLNLEQGAIAATALGFDLRRQHARWPVDVVPAFRLDGPALQKDRWHSFDREIEVAWRPVGPRSLELQVASEGEGASGRTTDGEPSAGASGNGDAGAEQPAAESVHRLTILGRDDRSLQVELDGVRQHWRLLRRPAHPAAGPLLDDNDLIYLHFGRGEAMVSLAPRFPSPLAGAEDPGSLVAPTPASVARVVAEVGQRVSRGDVLVVLEAMKMEQSVAAPSDGVVAEVLVEVGEAVDQGAVLVRIDEDEPDA